MDVATDEPDTNENAKKNEKKKTDPLVPTMPKVDPIFVDLMPNWPEFLVVINTTIVETEIFSKLAGDVLKLFPKSISDYRKIQDFLVKEKIPFHALPPKSERPHKVLIRGLPGITETAKVKALLESRGYQIISVVVLRKRKTREALPLFLVHVKTAQNWETIYDIKNMMNIYVTITPFETRGVRQCYRCQRYGHSSMTCSMPERCVRCGEGHNSKLCKRSLDEDATCILCKGPHPANYKKCPANPANKGAKNPKQQGNQQRNNASKVFTPAPLPKNPAWQKNNNANLALSAKEFPALPTKMPVLEAATSGSEPSCSKATQERGKTAPNGNGANYGAKATTALKKGGSNVSEVGNAINAFKEIRDLLQGFKIKEMLLLLNQIGREMQNCVDPTDKLFVLLESMDSFAALLPSK